MFMRLNTQAVALMAIFLVFLAGCSKIPAPVHVDLAIDAEKEAADADSPGASMSELWSAKECLGIYVRHSHKIGDSQPAVSDNLKYTNSEEEASSTARFVTDTSIDICEGDLIAGYLPYSAGTDVSVRTKSASQSIVRPFTLGVQLQNGDNSTAHVEELDFMTASPATVNEAILAEVPDVSVHMSFTHAFAALKFELKNKFHRSMKIQRIVLESNDNAALTGDYEIDLITQSVTAAKPVPSVELTFNNAGRTEVNGQLTGYAVVNAATLSAGAALTVFTSVGTFRHVTTSDILLERGSVTKISMSLSSETLDGKETEVSADKCLGSWKLTSFCSRPAEFDVYITLRDNGTFTLYQRGADSTPARYAGNFTFDPSNSVISGSYDDGTAWVDSYKVEDADGDEMIWTNTADSSEKSVYTRSDIPASMLGKAGRTNRTSGQKFL